MDPKRVTLYCHVENATLIDIAMLNGIEGAWFTDRRGNLRFVSDRDIYARLERREIMPKLEPCLVRGDMRLAASG